MTKKQATGRKYFTVNELVEEAIQMAKEDPLFKEAVERTKLDYYTASCRVAHENVMYCTFSVVSDVTYGSSEGIYGSLQFDGNWAPGQEGRTHVFSLKTLSTEKEAYLGMGSLVNLISYYANQLIGENLDRFD